jgi:hypothetical protein
MIDELKQILTMVEKVPETVLWVLFGFAVYKLVVWLSATGATVMLVKLAIDKLHDYLVRPATKAYDINGTLVNEPTKAKFDQLIAVMRTLRYKRASSESERLRQAMFAPYIWESEVDFVIAKKGAAV